MHVGEAIRKAKEKGEDPKNAFVESSGAYEIFEGRVTAFESEGKGGFNWGNWHIKGTNDFDEHKMRVWFKNEHLISWIDNKPYVTCPVLLCIVESANFGVLSNFVQSGTHDAKDVTVFGLKAIDLWRTPKWIEVFGPQHFGFDIEYVPVEKRIPHSNFF